MAQTKAQLVVGLNVNASAPASALQIDASGNVNLDSNTLYVDATNNRVGIGNSSPGANLDIYTSASRYVRVFPSSGLADLEVLSNNNSQPVFAVKGTGSADLFRAFANTTQAVTIDSSGRLGIGTTPASKLDVGITGVANLANTTISSVSTFGANGSFGFPGLANNLDGVYFGMGAGGGNGIPAGIGFFREASGWSSALAFYTNNITSGPNGTNAIQEKARIDSSGRLLVGTSTARTNLFNTSITSNIVQVEGAANSTGISVIANGNAGETAYLALCRSKGTTIGSNTVVANGDTLGTLSFQGSDGTEFVDGARVQAEVDGTPGANDLPTRLVFSTTADGASSPTERMRINNAGATGFFNAGDTVWSASSTGAGTVQAIYVGSHSGAGVYGGTVSYKVFTNGNVQNTNGSYTTLSDAKLKENIVDANSQWDDLKAIQIRSWNFKEETGHETHRQIGPIAQELETICPGLVFETADRDEDGNETGEVTKGVNQSVLYMKAVKALQEAMERIEQLEAKVSVLESKP